MILFFSGFSIAGYLSSFIMDDSLFVLNASSFSDADQAWNGSTTTTPAAPAPPTAGAAALDGLFNGSDVTLPMLRNLSRSCSPYLFAAFEIFIQSGAANRSTAKEIFSLCPELVDSSDVFYWEELAPALIIYS